MTLPAEELAPAAPLTSPAQPVTVRRLSGKVMTNAASWGVADQALISVAGFVATVLLARSLSQEGFGTYTLVFSAVLLSNAIQTGLIASPHNIVGATRQGAAYVRYTSTTAVAQLVLSATAATVGLVAAAVATVLAPDAIAVALAAAALLATSSLQNYTRRILYTETRPRSALATDLAAYGGQIAAFVVLWQTGSLTALSALWALTATSAVGAVVGFWQLRSSLAMRASWADARDTWRLGGWLAANQVAGWATFNVYLFLAAALVGTAATAALRASQVIIGPLNVLQAYLPLALIPRFARTLADGGAASLRRDIGRVYTRTAPLFAAYCLLAALLAKPLLHVLYGGAYDRYWPVVTLLAAYAFLSYTGEVLASALSASRRPRAIFLAYSISGGFALMVGWLLIVFLGANGAALGLVVNSIVLNAILLWDARRSWSE
jgi:O-antigen/teichoic acid export membrane protein